jgi:hypothetical protein
VGFTQHGNGDIAFGSLGLDRRTERLEEEARKKAPGSYAQSGDRDEGHWSSFGWWANCTLCRDA